MSETQPFEPTWASPPGDTIEDLLVEKGWTAAQFAERMGYTPKHVNELLRGRASITAETALRLESVLGSTAQFWLSRESQYQEAVARKGSNASLHQEAEWLSTLPLKHMVERKWISKLTDTAAQVAGCLRFFGVSSVRAWHETYSKPVEEHAAFRSSTNRAMQLGAVVAWLRQGEIIASGIKTQPWDKAAFKATLPEIRKLTLESDPQKFLPEIRRLCAQCGVAFVHLKVPKGCPVDGATKFLSPEKALLMLSFRYLRDDAFWFTFFHEAGHLLLHPKRTMFLEVRKHDGREEDEANQFAADTLVPTAHQDQLPQLRTQLQIQEFAKVIGTSPGVVLGQLHHRKLIPFERFRSLLVGFEWAK